MKSIPSKQQDGKASTSGKLDDTARVEALTLSLNEAVEELISLRRTHRQSEERADRLRVELAEAVDALRLLEERSAAVLARKEREFAEGLEQQRLAFEISALEQREFLGSLQVSLEASEKAIGEVAHEREAFQNSTHALNEIVQRQLQVAESRDAAQDRLQRDITEIAAARAKAEAEKKALEKKNEELAAELQRGLAIGDERRSAHQEKLEELYERLADLGAARSEALVEVRLLQADKERLSAELERSLAAGVEEKVAANRRAEAAALAVATAEVAAARHSTEAQLLRHSLTQVALLIEAVVDEPRNHWQRLLRGRPSPALRALASWASRPSFSPPSSHDHEVEESSVQGPRISSPQPLSDERNPYLRADSLADLLSFNDVDFVRCAYVTILGRQPDPNGEGHFTQKLREGTSKFQIVWALRHSAEGPKHDPGIAGLDRILRRYRRARLPLIGRVLSPRYAVEHDEGERRMRRLENALWRTHGSMRAHLSYVESRFEQSDALIRELFSTLQGAISQSRVGHGEEAPKVGSRSQEKAVSGTPAPARTDVRDANGLVFGRGTRLGQAPSGNPWRSLPEGQMLPLSEVMDRLDQEIAAYAG